MKILYGVCGIGNGHIFRQLPQISRHLRQGDQLIIYGYGQSYEYFKKMEEDFPNLKVLPVAVPYLLGNKDGLDLLKSIDLSVNNQSFFQINTKTMEETKKILGTPDKVISDYEPISAQYAYMMGTPLHTFDQQSKFLFGDFPQEINGCTYTEEVERLRLFFPKAKKRIIASFFNFKLKEEAIGEEIVVIEPPISDRTRKIKEMNYPPSKDILIYLSPQVFSGIYQAPFLIEKIAGFCQKWSALSYKFHCYLPEKYLNEVASTSQIINLYPIGNPSYDQHLGGCCGIIATAGHGLLSETVYLNKQVLAIALDLYEQQLNAKMIEEMGLGIHTTVHKLSQEDVDNFFEQLRVN